MKYLPWFGGGLAVFLLLALPHCTPDWETDRAVVLAGVRAREAQADSLLAYGRALVDSGVALRLTALRRKAQGEAAFRSALNLRDSLASVAIPDTCLPLARGWRQTVDSLLVAHTSDSLAFVALEGSLARMDTAYRQAVRRGDLLAENVDSLTALVRRTPKERWWAPHITAGYGAVVSGGAVRVGPGVQAGFRIRF